MGRARATKAGDGHDGNAPVPLLQALPSRELRRIRQAGTDDVGHDVRVFVNDKEPGSPLRCCLREAHVGERVALVAWRPRNVQAGCYMCAIRRR